MSRHLPPHAEARAGPELVASGWTEGHAGNAQLVAQSLGWAFGGSHEVQEVAANALRFSLDLSGIRLRGLSDHTRCLLLGGASEATWHGVQEFWKREAHSTQLALVFCASPEAGDYANRFFPRGCVVVLNPTQTGHLVKDEGPVRLLKGILRAQLNRRRLSLYDTTSPATGNAYFGRQRELACLADNRAVNYAVPGPGRIGKSSLLKRYKWSLVKSRDPRAQQLREIDFYAVGSADRDRLARHIALGIQNSSWADRVTVDTLLPFLRVASEGGRQPFELLLDEVDEVCTSEPFQVLGQAAKERYVRLIMAGRHSLYDFARNPKSGMQGRLELMRLEPLEKKDAHDLIRNPLEDLGLVLHDGDKVLDLILQRSGGLPHLIQYYCRGLVELTIERDKSVVCPALLAELESNGGFAQYFLSFLSEMRDPQAAALARAALRKDRPRYSLNELAELAGQRGPDADLSTIRRMADGLVIQNILAWDNVHYRPANQALRYFASQAGLLD